MESLICWVDPHLCVCPFLYILTTHDVRNNTPGNPVSHRVCCEYPQLRQELCKYGRVDFNITRHTALSPPSISHAHHPRSPPSAPVATRA